MMSIRKTTDFPLCQYAPDGAFVALSPELAYYVYQGLTETLCTEFRMSKFEGMQAVRDNVRGASYDAPRLEMAAFVTELLVRHDLRAQEALPRELRVFLYGQEDETP